MVENKVFKLTDYLGACVDHLKEGNLQGVQNTFNLLRKIHPEYQARFVADLPHEIRRHYLLAGLKSADKEAMFSEWAETVTDWYQELKKAPQTKKIGMVARWQKMSLEAYEQKRLDEGRH